MPAPRWSPTCPSLPSSPLRSRPPPSSRPGALCLHLCLLACVSSWACSSPQPLSSTTSKKCFLPPPVLSPTNSWVFQSYPPSLLGWRGCHEVSVFRWSWTRKKRRRSLFDNHSYWLTCVSNNQGGGKALNMESFCMNSVIQWTTYWNVCVCVWVCMCVCVCLTSYQQCFSFFPESSFPLKLLGGNVNFITHSVFFWAFVCVCMCVCVRSDFGDRLGQNIPVWQRICLTNYQEILGHTHFHTYSHTKTCHWIQTSLFGGNMFDRVWSASEWHFPYLQ